MPAATIFRDVLPNADYTLTSPNYPYNYPTDMELIWALQAAEGHKIQLSFNEFKLSFDDSLTVNSVYKE